MLRLFMIALLTGFLALGPASAQKGEKAIYDENKTSIVKIQTTISAKEGTTMPETESSRSEEGTGVVISPTGLVLTAAHVIGCRPKQRNCETISNRTITVKRIDVGDREHPPDDRVFVRKVEPDLDLALLQLGNVYDHAKLSFEPPSETLPVTAVFFNPDEDVPRALTGNLSPPNRARYGDRWVLAMGVIPGNSGAPVFDAAGNVVAIITNQRREADKRFALAAPLASARNFLPPLSEEEIKACVKARREIAMQPEWREKPASVSCPGSVEDASTAEPKSDEVVIDVVGAPGEPKYEIAGPADHQDDVNPGGWVGAVEYGQADIEGPVTSAKLKVYCMPPLRSTDPPARASAKLRVPVRKVVSDAELRKSCASRL